MVEPTHIEDIGLRVEKADDKGLFLIEEHEDFKEPNKLYVYIDEIDILVQKLRKAKHEWNNKNEFVEHSLHSESKPHNPFAIFKDFDVEDFKEYNRYIRSDEWQRKRQERLQLDWHRCKNCGGKIGLEVHHKNYSGLRNEDVSGLATLCSECHDKVTKINRKKRKVVLDNE